MSKAKGAIVVDKEKCKGCEVCITACPHQVIGMTSTVNAKGYRVASMVLPEACTGCTNCALVCPDGVISVYRLKAASVA